jgi:GTPase SAR1 family protein
VLLVFDLTNLKSFRNVRHWLHELKTYSHEHIRVSLLGNKADMTAHRQVSEEEVREFTKEHHIERYYECSALSGLNIEQPFLELAGHILKAIEEGQIRPGEDSASGVKIKSSPHRQSFMKIAHPAMEKKEEERCAC